MGFEDEGNPSRALDFLLICDDDTDSGEKVVGSATDITLGAGKIFI